MDRRFIFHYSAYNPFIYILWSLVSLILFCHKTCFWKRRAFGHWTGPLVFVRHNSCLPAQLDRHGFIDMARCSVSQYLSAADVRHDRRSLDPNSGEYFLSVIAQPWFFFFTYWPYSHFFYAFRRVGRVWNIQPAYIWLDTDCPSYSDGTYSRTGLCSGCA